MSLFKRLSFFLSTRPKLAPSVRLMRELDIIRHDVKQFGYYLAKEQYSRISQEAVPTSPGRYNVGSMACKQSDLETDWFRYWCSELKLAPLFNRKLWEYAVILQVLYENDHLKSGSTAVGFGCGEEPLAAYFASKGVSSLVTDLALSQVEGKGWIGTGQHASSLEAAFHAQLVSRDVFNKHTKHRFVDMNSIPEDLGVFDFAWSVCAMEHVGGFSKGMNFVKNSLNHVRSGGIVIHTTEFSYLRNDVTVETDDLVLFQKKHFQDLFEHLSSQGHNVFMPSFEVGTKPLDMHIDLPPYNYVKDNPWLPDSYRQHQENHPSHLKISVAGVPSTCFAIVIKKK
jgi:hypothetical protein